MAARFEVAVNICLKQAMRIACLTCHTFLCAQYVLGTGGTILMLTIVFMAVTSAGSAEMMAVSSLVTYDIYKARPCRPALPSPAISNPIPPFLLEPHRPHPCGLLRAGHAVCRTGTPCFVLREPGRGPVIASRRTPQSTAGHDAGPRTKHWRI